MAIIRLPLDTKSLYFNIKNDNATGHTATVATPLRKVEGPYKLEDILKITDKEFDFSNKGELVEQLIKHSKSSVIIRHVYVFNDLTVNGIKINTDYSFVCYIKEEVDETKVQFGRLKLHYPPKLVYEDCDVSINNRAVYQAISKILHDYAFIIRYFEYNTETGTLNFDALIVGEQNIPYSKVFIINKGVGSKFNRIFNENADDYDEEIIALRKQYGDQVDPFNYLEYFQKMKIIALEKIKKELSTDIELISDKYPYSLFDFCYSEQGIKKYGILRVSATKNKYFNLSIIQNVFMDLNKEEVNVFLVTDIFGQKDLTIFNHEALNDLSIQVNSVKYREG